MNHKLCPRSRRHRRYRPTIEVPFLRRAFDPGRGQDGKGCRARRRRREFLSYFRLEKLRNSEDRFFWSPARILVRLDDSCINHVTLLVACRRQLFEDFHPKAGLRPPIKSCIICVPGAVVLRQVSPRSSRAKYPKHRVDHLPVRLRTTTSAPRLRRQQCLQSFPFFIPKLVASTHSPAWSTTPKQWKARTVHEEQLD